METERNQQTTDLSSEIVWGECTLKVNLKEKTDWPYRKLYITRCFKIYEVILTIYMLA